jgi:6-pyruvoyltetrahydropterin/6-carboxytetrahydropterin synthase
MWVVTKRFDFSASHQLAGLPADHPCSRVHGHNYRLHVSVCADTVDGAGFVLDFRDMGPVKRWVDDELDHRHLNDVFPAMNPTSENLAEHVGRWVIPSLLDLPDGVTVHSVQVCETDKTSAVWTPGGGS